MYTCTVIRALGTVISAPGTDISVPGTIISAPGRDAKSYVCDRYTVIYGNNWCPSPVCNRGVKLMCCVASDLETLGSSSAGK